MRHGSLAADGVFLVEKGTKELTRLSSIPTRKKKKSKFKDYHSVPALSSIEIRISCLSYKLQQRS